MDQNLRAGTLDILERLERQTQFLTTVQRQLVDQTDNLDDLRKHVQQLKEEKVTLEMKLQQSRSRSTVVKLLNQKSVVPSAAELAKAKSDVIHGAAERVKRRRATETKIAYRLAGRTVFPLSKERVGLRFDTFADGRYLEPYYAIFNLNDGGRGQMSLFRHTIPYFIPAEDLAAKYLNKDLKLFMSVVGDLLNAFVDRRQQLLKLKEEYGDQITGEIVSSRPFDEVEFQFQLNGKPYQVRLVYENLQLRLPSMAMVNVITDREATSVRFNQFEDKFLRMSLSQALAAIL